MIRWTTILIFICCLHVSARTYSQQITLQAKNAPLASVLKTIRKQSGINIIGRTELLNKALPITADIQNMPLTKALEICFKNQPLTYDLIENTIVLKLKNVAPVNPPPPDSSDVLYVPPVQIIQGKVTDSNGKPLPGVTVSVKGTKAATATDENGNFSFSNIDPDKAVLVFSYIGYERKTIVFKDEKEVNVTLIPIPHELDSMTLNAINTGYQKIKPEQSTGAVSSINTKEYESQININFLDGLVNKLPGLMINNDVKFTSTDPNGKTTSRSLFNIRGISTISGNQDPLIVVDGYPTTLALDMIDPNEIKSVNILKDAAAAAIYGVRASNGVIVIERKQAKVGRPHFAFRTTVGFTPKENYSRYRWASDASALGVAYGRNLYSTSVNANTYNSLFSFNGKSAYPPVYYVMAQLAANLITPYQAEEAFKAMSSYNNAKDYSRLLLQTAVTQTYNLDISGGNPNALYYITANFTRNKAQQINNNNNRILLSGRTTLQLSKHFSLELTTDYHEAHVDAAPVLDINSLYPYEHLQDEDGNPVSISANSSINPYYNNVIMDKGLQDYLYYPLVDVNHINDKTHTVNNRITANFGYKIGYGFNLTFGGVYETSRTDILHYADAQSSEANQYVDKYVTQTSDGSLVFNIPLGGILQQTASNTSSYTLRAQLNYNKLFRKGHSINAILGGEMRNETSQGSLASYFGYNDQTLIQQPVDYTALSISSFLSPFLGNGPLEYSSLFGQSYSDNRYLSGYSNIVYAYQNTYSLTGSMRIDQSNLFGTNPKYRYKPLWSIGAAWNINKEHFLKNVNWLRLLKLRIADGFNGNVAKLSLPEVIAQSYLTTATIPSSTALASYSLANSSLRWEQTNNFNIGMDYRIFKNLYGSIDWYSKRSTDLLANGKIDPTAGATSSIINTATINNRGLEISLHADWINTPNVNWNTGFVLAHNTSKVLNVYQTSTFSPVTLNTSGYVKGYPVSALFAYRYTGLDTAGFPMIKNEKGDIYHTNQSGITAVMTSDTSGVIRFMGSSIPTINAGMSNRIDIDNFYLYVMINYYGGFKVQVPRPNPTALRPLPGAEKYWKQPGDEQHSDVMSLNAFNNINYTYARYAYNYADSYAVNGDYISLSDITVSYNLDNNRFFKKIGFTHFEIKLQASNLWTVGFNKYNYSIATGSYYKPYLTPTYTIGIFTNF